MIMKEAAAELGDWRLVLDQLPALDLRRSRAGLRCSYRIRETSFGCLSSGSAGPQGSSVVSVVSSPFHPGQSCI